MNLCFDTGNDPYEIPTTIQFYPHDPIVYIRNFAGSGKWHQRLNGLRIALRHENWISRLYALFDYACRHGRTFHLWGHSKQFEQLNAWNDLDDFLRHVAERVAVQDRLSNAQLVTHAPTMPAPAIAQTLSERTLP